MQRIWDSVVFLESYRRVTVLRLTAFEMRLRVIGVKLPPTDARRFRLALMKCVSRILGVGVLRGSQITNRLQISFAYFRRLPARKFSVTESACLTPACSS